jgi:hypothetical protein
VGDVLDVHHYPEPVMPEIQENRAIVLGEFGGLGYPVAGHTWVEHNWGYRNMPDTLELLELYESFYATVYAFVNQGLSAAVYTQTTDVETETNGLLTYDRRIKLEPEALSRANQGYTPPVLENPVRIFLDSYQAVLSTGKPGSTIHYTTDGSKPDENAMIYDGTLTLTETTNLKTLATWEQNIESRVVEYFIEKVNPQPASTEYGLKPGLRVDVYRGAWESLPPFDSLKVSETIIVPQVDLLVAPDNEDFGLVYSGTIKLPADAIYTFALGSDDGSRLFINGKRLIDNDGIHGNRVVEGSLALEKGHHHIRLEYFQHLGGQGLRLEIYMMGKKIERLDPQFTHAEQ